MEKTILRYFTATILFVFLSHLDSYGQKKIEEIFINTNSEFCLGFCDQNYSKNSDSSNIYVHFEENFINDTVTVFREEIEIFKEIIKSNGIINLTKAVKVGDAKTTKYIKIKINENPTIKINVEKEKYYYRINISWLSRKLEICNSKFSPTYK